MKESDVVGQEDDGRLDWEGQAVGCITHIPAFSLY